MKVSLMGQELLAVRILFDNPEGLYFNEIVSLSKGIIATESMTSMVGRLVRKGVCVRATGRVQHAVLVKLTASGSDELLKWREMMGVAISHNHFRRKDSKQ